MSENEENGIIINGVDVFDCQNIIFRYHDGKSERFYVCECGVQDVVNYNVMCSDNPECYYKQLQRTQIQYNKLAEQNRSLQKELRQKNQEIEAFKLSEGEAVEIIADLEEKLSEFLVKNKKLTEDFNEICKRHNEAFDEFNKLKQTNEKLRKTLKEIEEIAKTKIYTPVCFEYTDCPKNGGIGFNNNCDEYCPLITIERILEKIKEVEK